MITISADTLGTFFEVHARPSACTDGSTVWTLGFYTPDRGSWDYADFADPAAAYRVGLGVMLSDFFLGKQLTLSTLNAHEMVVSSNSPDFHAVVSAAYVPDDAGRYGWKTTIDGDFHHEVGTFETATEAFYAAFEVIHNRLFASEE